MFPQVPNVFPNMFSIAPHLYPICFGKCCPPFTYTGGPKGRRNSILQNRSFYFGGPIKLACCKKEKKLGRHLIQLIDPLVLGCPNWERIGQPDS